MPVISPGWARLGARLGLGVHPQPRPTAEPLTHFLLHQALQPLEGSACVMRDAGAVSPARGAQLHLQDLALCENAAPGAAVQRLGHASTLEEGC